MAFPWLYDKLVSTTSQHGEDGLLAAIFDKIGIKNSWCVDLGASDGYFISNTWNLVHNNKWSAVMIEADPKPFARLKKRYADREDIFCYNEFVTPENDLDSMLARTSIPENFDLLCIDIDGMDYKIWERLSDYKPRVVVIEINCTMDKDIDLVQETPEIAVGSSVRAMTRLAKSKGYELAAHVISNAIFVEKSEFTKLEIEDNSVESLFFSPFVPKAFSDLRGVHYLLKEGAWGFSGMVHANDFRSWEDGDAAAKRNIVMTDANDPSVQILHRQKDYNFTARMAQQPELLKLLKFYIANNRKAQAGTP